MNYLIDGLVIVVLLIYTISCAKKGFIECLFGLISTVASFALAFMLMNSVVEWTNGFFGLAEKAGIMAASGAAWVTIFIVVKLVIRFIKKVVSAIVDKIPLVGSLNHLLGLIVGIAEGLLIVWLVLAVLSLIANTPDMSNEIMNAMEETFLAKELFENNPVRDLMNRLITEYHF
ncbi:MAG: CvpA family protein [Clostridia bacterium]|nr:CvpA family protein [Clostridia bacterium]